MSTFDRNAPVDIRSVMGPWLKDSFDFTHLVTLTTHDNTLTEHALRNRLKDWDARVNRKLYGPKWKKHADELIWYFAFLEKPTSNPHWHLLLRVVGAWNADLSRDYQELPDAASNAWHRISPAGTVDVQEIVLKNRYNTVADYVAKELSGDIQYRSFLTPDEFRRF